MAAYKQNKMRIILSARLCSDFPHRVRRGAIIRYNSPTLANEVILATVFFLPLTKGESRTRGGGLA